MKTCLTVMASFCIATVLAACATGVPRSESAADGGGRESSRSLVAEAQAVPVPEVEPLSCGVTKNPALCRRVADIRAVNLGNALEAPREGMWGVRLNEEDFRLIAGAGFDTVRVPIRWSAHAAAQAPYTVDDSFFERVDWVIEQSRRNGLLAIINMHHYDEIFVRPDDHSERFVAIWRQIAERYAEVPTAELWFELLNEPHGALVSLAWQRLMAATLDVVRASNPNRPVVVGGADWNSLYALGALRVPDDDHLVLTFHYYHPFVFTHQGASWTNMEDTLGIPWHGNEALRRDIDTAFETARRYATMHRLPLLLGEFGAYSKADMLSRVRWTSYVRKCAEAHGFGWAYWEFRAGFGVYDASAARWQDGLAAALLNAPPRQDP